MQTLEAQYAKKDKNPLFDDLPEEIQAHYDSMLPDSQVPIYGVESIWVERKYYGKTTEVEYLVIYRMGCRIPDYWAGNKSGWKLSPKPSQKAILV